MGERLLCKQEVGGSIPPGSTFCKSASSRPSRVLTPRRQHRPSPRCGQSARCRTRRAARPAIRQVQAVDKGMGCLHRCSPFTSTTRSSPGEPGPDGLMGVLKSNSPGCRQDSHAKLITGSRAPSAAGISRRPSDPRRSHPPADDRRPRPTNRRSGSPHDRHHAAPRRLRRDLLPLKRDRAGSHTGRRRQRRHSAVCGTAAWLCGPSCWSGTNNGCQLTSPWGARRAGCVRVG
jgi:hypothetical protein